MAADRSDKEGKEENTTENILRITDELLSELNKARRLLIITIIVVVVSIPLAWHAAPLFSGTPDRFRFIGFITLAVAAFFLFLGIRQWLTISRWMRRYREYKEKISKIDRELDFEDYRDSDKEE